MLNNPKRCPFCGDELTGISRWGYFRHEDNGCFLSTITVVDDEEAVEKWNRRFKE